MQARNTGKNAPPFPVWVLNLERDVTRRFFMDDQLRSLGWNFEFVSAIDGENLTDEDLSNYDEVLALKAHKMPLANGEIGCALSHIKMWQRMVAEELEMVLILEDDVMLHEDFSHLLSEHARYPSGWEMINFCTDAKQQPTGPMLLEKYRISKHLQWANRNSSYLLKLKGAKKLLGNALPIRFSSDELTGRTYLTNIISYGCTPQPVSLAEFESSIWGQQPPSYLQPDPRGLKLLMLKTKILGRRWLGDRLYFDITKKVHWVANKLRGCNRILK